MRLALSLATLALFTTSAHADVQAILNYDSNRYAFSLPDSLNNQHDGDSDSPSPAYFSFIYSVNGQPLPLQDGDPQGFITFFGGYSFNKNNNRVSFLNYGFNVNLPFVCGTCVDILEGRLPGIVTSDANGGDVTLTFASGTFLYQDDDAHKLESLTIIAPDAVTPEPSTLALLGTGLFGAVGIMRRRVSLRRSARS